MRFDGSLVTAPLMVLANLYLLCWDYHKLKLVFPFNRQLADSALPKPGERHNRFPLVFFAGVFATVLLAIANVIAYDMRPYNTISDCKGQCETTIAVLGIWAPLTCFATTRTGTFCRLF